MSSIIELADGTVGVAGDDGWVHELAAPTLPQRDPLTGPRPPVELLPVELMQRFADAVREWGES